MWVTWLVIEISSHWSPLRMTWHCNHFQWGFTRNDIETVMTLQFQQHIHTHIHTHAHMHTHIYIGARYECHAIVITSNEVLHVMALKPSWHCSSNNTYTHTHTHTHVYAHTRTHAHTHIHWSPLRMTWHCNCFQWGFTCNDIETVMMLELQQHIPTHAHAHKHTRTHTHTHTHIGAYLVDRLAGAQKTWFKFNGLKTMNCVCVCVRVSVCLCLCLCLSACACVCVLLEPNRRVGRERERVRTGERWNDQC